MKAVLTILFLVACGLGPAIAQMMPQDFRSHSDCQDVENSFRCARLLEARLLSALPGVRRMGDTLAIEVGSGSPVRLVDEPGTPKPWLGAEPSAFSYFGQFPDSPLHLVHAQHGEGNSYVLVHDGGGWTEMIEGYPVISPDGAWGLVSETGYYNRQGVFLYHVTADSLESHLRLEAPLGWLNGWGWWQDSVTAAVVEVAPHYEWETPSTPIDTVWIHRANGRWTVQRD